MSHTQHNQVIREREWLVTARTVAAMLRDEYDNSNGDDISNITTPTTNANGHGNQGTTNTSATAGSTRSIEQLSLNSIGQAFNGRCLNALATRKKPCAPTGVYFLNKEWNSLLSSQVGLSCQYMWCKQCHQDSGIPGSSHQSFRIFMTPIQDVPIVKAALAIDDPETGETTILVIKLSILVNIFLMSY